MAEELKGLLARHPMMLLVLGIICSLMATVFGLAMSEMRSRDARMQTEVQAIYEGVSAEMRSKEELMRTEMRSLRRDLSSSEKSLHSVELALARQTAMLNSINEIKKRLDKLEGVDAKLDSIINAIAPRRIAGTKLH